MLNETVGKMILRFIHGNHGRATYREIRSGLAINLGGPQELVVWNEVMQLIHEDRALDNSGVMPGDRDRLTVILTPQGRDMLRPGGIAAPTSASPSE